MKALTVAQLRKENPVFDNAVRAVVAVRASGLPSAVAHIHPDTLKVSIILHGDRATTDAADRVLVDHGIPAGGWQLEPGHDHEIHRKQVTR